MNQHPLLERINLFAKFVEIVTKNAWRLHYDGSLHQQSNFLKSKVKFRQASNRCKRVLEAAKLAYATNTKESFTSQKLGFATFGELLIAFSRKLNLLCLVYSTAQRCCLLLLVKQNCLLKTFLRTLILMTWVLLCLFSLLELI